MGCVTSKPAVNNIVLKKQPIILDESIHGNSDHGDLNVIDTGEIIMKENHNEPIDEVSSNDMEKMEVSQIENVVTDNEKNLD